MHKIFEKLKKIRITYWLSWADQLASVSVASKPLAGKTLIIIRLDAIGDYLLFRNFISEIKNSDKYKGYRIFLLGNAAWRSLAETFDQNEVDQFIWINVNQFNQSFSYRYEHMKKILTTEYSSCINPMHSRMYLNERIVKFIKADEKIALNNAEGSNINPRHLKTANSYYSRIIQTPRENIFEFNRSKIFFSKLLEKQLTIQSPALPSIPPYNKTALSNKYIVIFPGGSSHSKRWSPANFAWIADWLADHYPGINIVLVGSPEEVLIGKNIVELSNTANIVNLTGKTSLIELVELIAHAQLLISNESSAVHIAAGSGTPTVCIAYSLHFGRFAPYPKDICTHIHYVFHPEIMKRWVEFDKLKEKYRYASDLNIDEINTTSVLEKIKEAGF